MPIADILRHKEVVVQHSVSGTESSISSRYTHAFGLQAGILNRAEGGLDHDYQGNAVYNLKVQLLDEQATKFGAFSVGTMNYVRGKGDWYSVGRYDGSGYRVHAGFLSSDEMHAMVGVDAPFHNGTVSLEYMGGNGGSISSSYTFNVPQVSGLAVQLVLTRPNDAADGLQHSAVVSYGFRF